MIDNNIENGNRPTAKQIESLERLKKEWGTNPKSQSYDGICDCLMICMDSKLWKTEIWIGIETDGYAHS
jgi:hypothetical protein